MNMYPPLSTQQPIGLEEPKIDLTGVPSPNEYTPEMFNSQFPMPQVTQPATQQPLMPTPAPQTYVPEPLLDPRIMPLSDQMQQRQASDPLQNTPQPTPSAENTPLQTKPIGEVVNDSGDVTEGEKSPIVVPVGNVQKDAPSVAPQEFSTTTQSTTSTQSTIYGKEDKVKYEEASKNYKEAMEAQKNILSRVTDDPEIKNQLTRVVSTTLALEDLLDPTSDNFVAYKKDLDKTKEELDKSEKALSDFQKEAKVDPNRFMSEMPTSSKALTAIAMMLEGYGSAVAARGGMQIPSGMIAKQLNEAILQDMNLQREQMASKEKGMTGDINRYAKNLALLKDERAAEIKTKSDLLMVSKSVIDNLKARYADEASLAEFDKVQKGLEMQIAQQNLEMNKRIVNSNMTITKTPVNRGGMDTEKMLDIRKKALELGEYDLNLFNEFALPMRSKDSAQKTSQMLGSYGGMVAKLDALDALEGRALPGEVKKAVSSSIYQDLLIDAKTIYELGVLAGPDMDIIETFIKNPTDIAALNAVETLKSAKQTITNRIANNINANLAVGTKPVSAEFLLDRSTKRGVDYVNRTVKIVDGKPQKAQQNPYGMPPITPSK
jgi:tetratricopeptide (TPR) repeat protein